MVLINIYALINIKFFHIKNNTFFPLIFSSHLKHLCSHLTFSPLFLKQNQFISYKKEIIIK